MGSDTLVLSIVRARCYGSGMGTPPSTRPVPLPDASAEAVRAKSLPPTGETGLPGVSLADLDTPDDVNGEDVVRWLETGEKSPWPE